MDTRGKLGHAYWIGSRWARADAARNEEVTSSPTRSSRGGTRGRARLVVFIIGVVPLLLVVRLPLIWSIAPGWISPVIVPGRGRIVGGRGLLVFGLVPATFVTPAVRIPAPCLFALPLR